MKGKPGGRSSTSLCPIPARASRRSASMSGRWLIVHNDTEQGRHSLAVSLSEDEGETWPATRHLELVEPEQGSFSYPSVIQGRRRCDPRHLQLRPSARRARQAPLLDQARAVRRGLAHALARILGAGAHRPAFRRQREISKSTREAGHPCEKYVEVRRLVHRASQTRRFPGICCESLVESIAPPSRRRLICKR